MSIPFNLDFHIISGIVRTDSHIQRYQFQSRRNMDDSTTLGAQSGTRFNQTSHRRAMTVHYAGGSNGGRGRVSSHLPNSSFRITTTTTTDLNASSANTSNFELSTATIGHNPARKAVSLKLPRGGGEVVNFLSPDIYEEEQLLTGDNNHGKKMTMEVEINDSKKYDSSGTPCSETFL